MNLRAKRLNRQLNKNNKGSSLVTVLLVASIVAILVTVVLAIVILNVYMKKADLQGQNAFYDAETALEEIRAGLAKNESDATTVAYLDTLSNYSNYVDDKKTEEFDNTFGKTLKDTLTLKTGDYSGNYDVNILKSYIKNDRAELLTTEDEAFFNTNTKEGTKLFNVHVKYTDESGYVSEIKTDIVLEYPPVNFQNASSIDNILTYGLIANNQFMNKEAGRIDITGNAYIGGNGAVLNNANINFFANGTQETNVICGNNINMFGSTLTSDNLALWANNIVLDKSTFNMNSGSSYIKDDLVLGNNAKSTLKGKLIMFGNPWVARDDDGKMIESSEVREAAKEDMPSYSSSILVTGSNAGLDMSGLNTMVIGGSAYVDTASVKDKDGNKVNKQYYTEPDQVDSSGRTIKGKTITANPVTGQSLMLTSDQRAYLVPATLVGAEAKPVIENGQVLRYENYSHGLTNPMTAGQFKALEDDIRAAKGYGPNDVIPYEDYVNWELAEPTIGVSINNFWRAHVKEAIKKGKGYTDDSQIQLSDFAAYEYSKPTLNICYYPTTNGGTMVYLFLRFNTIGNNYEGTQNATYIPAEAFYNNWYKLYNSTLTNYTRLIGNLDYYAKYGIKLPKDVNDKTRMYFTGNILSTETNPVIVPDIITQSDFTIDLNVEYSKQSAYYQDAYYTLNKNLNTRYVTLSDSNKDNDLFTNLIDINPKVDGKDVPLSGTNYYMSTTGEAAVVTNGDFTYNSSSEYIARNYEDNKGDKHSQGKINIIIAKGDVTVSQNYEGMIIAGGDIIVAPDKSITANSDKAAKAMIATKYVEGGESKECAAIFVKNAARYLLGGTGNKDGDSGNITMKDYVTYRNWTRL